MEYLRNADILRFNKYKAYFDFELRKIDIDKHVAIQKYESQSTLTIDDINEDKKNANLQQYGLIKRMKDYLLQKDSKNIIVQM